MVSHDLRFVNSPSSNEFQSCVFLFNVSYSIKITNFKLKTFLKCVSELYSLVNELLILLHNELFRYVLSISSDKRNIEDLITLIISSISMWKVIIQRKAILRFQNLP